MNEDSGFTLIELMIVVAIIGILVAVGMPLYQNYVARSQVAEGFSLASGLKTALAEYHATHGKFPDNDTDKGNSVIGVEDPTSIKGKYVDKVTVDDKGNGTITVLFRPDSYYNGRFLRLTAIATGGAVSFPCTTDIEEPYRPKDCEEGVETDSDTDLFMIGSNSLLDDPILLPDEFDETDIDDLLADPTPLPDPTEEPAQYSNQQWSPPVRLPAHSAAAPSLGSRLQRMLNPNASLATITVTLEVDMRMLPLVWS